MLEAIEAQVYSKQIKKLSDDGTLLVRGHGRWYKGRFVRQKPTGAVVVAYTTGSGSTHEKTCRLDPVQHMWGFADLKEG